MKATADLFLYTTRRGLGAAGEMKVKEALEKQGYPVDASHSHKCGDLTAFDRLARPIYIEVKTARQNKRGEWCFTLFKKDNHTDHRACDFVILLAVLKTGLAIPFVIPCEKVQRVTAITFHTHPQSYAGKYAYYRQNINELRLK